MTIEWFNYWLYTTAYTCAAPLMAMLWAVGLHPNPVIAETVAMATFAQNTEPGSGLIRVILSVPLCLMIYALWPVMTLFMYGGACMDMRQYLPYDSGYQILNTFIVGVIGTGAGFYAASTILPRIDEHFGLDMALGGPIRAWDVAGTAYTAVKVAKLGRTIIRKI